VRALTADDIASGAYSIADVLLPIPGYATRFPSHAAGCAAAVAELMAGDGVIARADTAKLRAIADPAARDAVAVELMQPVWKPRARRDFQLAGSYRRLVECARDVQWRVVQHSTAEQQLVLTDLDTVQKRGLEPHLESDAGAAYLSLVLEFSLGRSCYATMALRELMRVETDKTFQASLNK
jgi:tRNA pseudouridine13 synthase